MSERDRLIAAYQQAEHNLRKTAEAVEAAEGILKAAKSAHAEADDARNKALSVMMDAIEKETPT